MQRVSLSGNQHGVSMMYVQKFMIYEDKVNDHVAGIALCETQKTFTTWYSNFPCYWH